TDKRLVVLDKYSSTSKYLQKFPELLFTVYPVIEENKWAIKSVLSEDNTFNYRKLLPESWAGKNDLELEKVTGVPGAVFCHRHSFIAAARTKEGILKLAEIALAA